MKWSTMASTVTTHSRRRRHDIERSSAKREEGNEERERRERQHRDEDEGDSDGRCNVGVEAAVGVNCFRCSLLLDSATNGE